MNIHYEVVGKVGVITIDNGPLNPTHPAMHRQLHDVLLRFLADDDVVCGVIHGSGDRAFCAGDDLKANLPELEPQAELLADLSTVHRLAGAADSWSWAYDNATLERYKPIVGAVRGWCLGGGLGLLISMTDIRVAGEDAKFGFPEIAYGMGGAGGSLQLARSIPYVEAMKMLLTGEPIDAHEARRIHLVNEVVPSEDVFDRAMAIAAKVASHPLLSVRIEMEGTMHAADLTRRDAMRFGQRLYQLQRLAVGESESESYAAARAKKTE